MIAQDRELTPGQRWRSMLAIQAGVAMTVVDGAIANIALPTIGHDLHATAAASIWVVNAYQIALAVVLLPLARLGEVLGYRRVFIGGLVLFTAASLGCAQSGSLVALTCWRVVQGIGAAGTLSVTSALIRHTYPPHMLGRGLGLNALMVGTFYALGPGIATAILAVGSWHWLFGVNVPFGIVIALAGIRALPPGERSAEPYDIRAAGLSIVAAAAAFATVEIISHGAGAMQATLCAAGAFLAGATLVRRERDRPAPLIPVDLLALPIFRLSLVASILSFTGQMLAYVALPFLLESSFGRSQTETGLTLTAWPVALAATGPFAGRIADRISPARVSGAGMLLYAAGVGLLLMLPGQPTLPDIAWRLALCGIGLGLFQSPNARLGMTATPLRRSGAAGGISSTARLFGQSFGTALVSLAFRLAHVRGPWVALSGAVLFALAAATVCFLRSADPAKDAAH
jgi:DHA2 family multidrug resistance protein-like MFS transporter